MDAKELTRIVNEELEHVPIGIAGRAQRKVRAVYSEMRRSSLPVDEDLLRAVTFAHTVATLRDSHPDFKPTLLDPGHFGWSE